MSDSDIHNKIQFFLDSGATPIFIRQGDSFWKKKAFRYKLIDLPGNREYAEDAILEEPRVKAKWGSVVTQDVNGFVTSGVGITAANFTVVDKCEDWEHELKRILEIDPAIIGLAFITVENAIVSWIDREEICE